LLVKLLWVQTSKPSSVAWHVFGTCYVFGAFVHGAPSPASQNAVRGLPSHWGSAKSLGGCPVIGGVPSHCGHAQSSGICLEALGGWRGFLRAMPERRAMALRRMRSRRGLRLKARRHKECGHRRKNEPIQTGDGNYFASRVQNHKRHGEARTVALRGAAPRPPGPPIFTHSRPSPSFPYA